MKSRLLLQDGQRWLAFGEPQRLIIAATPQEVPAALHAVSTAVEVDGLYAAGYLSYEAAAGLELATHAASGPPLLWFGLYAAPQVYEILPPVTKGVSQPSLSGPWEPALTETQYREAIATIKEYIARGHTYQVNYTYPLRNGFVGDAYAYFHQLVQAQQAAYAAFLDIGRFVICSASPELFFRLDGETLRSKPMKGTAPRGLTSAADEKQRQWLATSTKNRAENVMIVDMIRNDMGRVAALGSVHVPRLFEVERYPTLLQMTSTVEAQTTAPIGEILRHMFPCASITGAPKVRTMEIIRQLEPEPRGVYTGVIGFIAPASGAQERRAQFNVAIRTVVIDRERETAVYSVGSGIVWDSNAAEEYAECRLKADVLTVQRPRFSLLESLLWTAEEGYFLWAEHWHRLRQSADYFQYPLDQAAIQKALQVLSERLFTAHKVRLALGQDGQFTLDEEPLVGVAGISPPVRVGLAATPVDRQSVWLYHKTTRREMYAAARSERPDCDEVIMWNRDGELTEATTANLVLSRAGKLWTPPIESGLLAGTFRAALLAQGVIAERVLMLDDLSTAEEIFLINSVRKWRHAALVSQPETVFSR
jgi:para-aminobenzoate synthetase/4-amino-4-deoxychorismate lyase